MANLAYDKGKKALIDWLITQDVRVGLFTSSYTPAVNDDFLNNITANELSVAGYARQTLASMAATQDDANTRAYFTANNNVWASLTAGQTIGWAVTYINTGVDSTSKLIGAYQITPATPTNGSSFTVTWAAGASGGTFYLG